MHLPIMYIPETFPNVTNNTTMINPFNNNNRKIANNKTQHCQIMTTITNRILKLKSMIRKSIVADNTFFTVITFSRINSFKINYIVVKHL